MFKKHLLILVILVVLPLVTLCGCTQEKSSNDILLLDESNSEKIELETESIHTILTKTETIESMYYEIDASIYMSEFGIQTATVEIWQEEPYLKEKITSVSNGITSEITMIHRPEGIYVYDNDEHTYTITKEDFTSISTSLQYFDSGLIKNYVENQTLTNFETETIDGKEATIIQYTPLNEESPMTIKLWIWKDKGVPLKAFIDMTVLDTSITMEFMFSNYLFLDIPDSTFNVS